MNISFENWSIGNFSLQRKLKCPLISCSEINKNKTIVNIFVPASVVTITIITVEKTLIGKETL